MEKFKKIDREFQLSDSSLNSYSYRLLTEGYQLGEFQKNPIGYWMHGRDPQFPREMGALVRWEDLRVDGDRIFGKPSINLNHPRGQRTADEIESGFLNAASMGSMVALEMSTDPADKLPGQEGPTVKRWFNRECSLVDIPGNYNATAPDLYDANDQLIDLAHYTTQKQTMKKIELTAAMLATLLPNLSGEATQEQAEQALNDLAARAAKAATLETENSTLKTAKETAEQKLADLQAKLNTEKVEQLISDAQTAKKINQAAAEKLKVQYGTNPDGLKDLLDTLQPYQPITGQLTTGSNELKDLMAKSYQELDKAGKLERLQELSADAFFDKYKERFQKKHRDDKRD